MAITLVGVPAYGGDCDYPSQNNGFVGDGNGGGLPGDLVVVGEAWTIHPGDTPLSVTPPAGWSMIATDMAQEGGALLAWRILDGTEPTYAYFGYTPSSPASLFGAVVYRGDTPLQVTATATNQAVDQNSLSATLAGPAGAQLVLASCGDRGLFTSGYDPNFRRYEGAFTAIPDGFGGWLQQQSTGGFPVTIGSCFYFADGAGGTTNFTATPDSFGGPITEDRPWGVAMVAVQESGGGPSAQTLAPAGLAMAGTAGAGNLVQPVLVPTEDCGPVRVLEQGRAAGSWQATHTQVIWKLDCEELPLNASEISVKESPRWSAPVALSGDVLVFSHGENGEPVAFPSGPPGYRPGRLRDSPKQIQMTIPRLPLDFYHRLRYYKSFQVPAEIQIELFTALDPEELLTSDGRYYYASCGAWKAGSLVLFVNGTPVTTGFAANFDWGYVAFTVPLAATDRVTATYIWAPRVILTGELTPEFKAGVVPAEAKLVLTMQELRPPPVLDAFREAGLFVAPGALSSLAAFGAANLGTGAFAAAFPNSASRLSSTDATLHYGGGDWGVFAWVYLQGTVAAWVVGIGDETLLTPYEWTLTIANGGFPRFIVQQGLASAFLQSVHGLALNQWHLIYAGYTPNSMALSVDGQALETGASLPGITLQPGIPLTIGQDAGDSYANLYGKIDDVAILPVYYTDLSVIGPLWNGGAGLAYGSQAAPPVGDYLAYWNMDVLGVDSTPHGVTLTIEDTVDPVPGHI